MTPTDVVTMVVGLPVTVVGVAGALLYGCSLVIRFIAAKLAGMSPDDPVIRKTDDPLLSKWSCTGGGVTGYGPTPDKALEQWQAGRETVKSLALPVQAAASGLFEDPDAAAIALYISETGNDPHIHCNRFPTWAELADEARDIYRRRAHKRKLDDLGAQR